MCLRDITSQMELLHASVRNLFSSSVIHNIPSLAAALENIFATKYHLQGIDLHSPSEQNHLTLLSGKLHWLDSSQHTQSQKWMTVEVGDHSLQHSYEILSENRYRVIPSHLSSLVLRHLNSQDFFMTDWKHTESSKFKANAFLKIKIEPSVGLAESPDFSPPKSLNDSQGASEYVLEFSFQLSDDTLARNFDNPNLNNLSNLISTTTESFFYLLSALNTSTQHHKLLQGTSLQKSSLLKQFVTVMHLLDILYSKNESPFPNEQSEENSRLTAVLRHVEDILSAFHGLLGCEIKCEDTTENVTIYQSTRFAAKSPLLLHKHQTTVIHTPSSESDGNDSKSKYQSLYLSNVSELTPMTNITFGAHHSSIITPIPSSGHPVPIGAPPYPNVNNSTNKKANSDTESDGDDRADRFIFHTHDTPRSFASNSSASPKKAAHSYPVKFQVYEVHGTITFYSHNLLAEEMLGVLITLVRVIGRRIYELYRGKRNKKRLVNVQKDYDKARYHILLLLTLTLCDLWSGDI